MKTVIVVLALCLSQALAWKHVESKEKLLSALKKNEKTLVAYIRPEEENSQLLEPEWLSASKKNSNFLSIDCSKLPKICQNQGISSFPTIRLYTNQDNPTRYRGPRTAHSILTFLNRSSRPQITHLFSNVEVINFSTGDDIVFIAHLDSKSDQDKETFTSLAKKYSDRYSFGLATSSSSKIECFNNPDSLTHSTTDLSLQNLNIFIQICSTPLIAEITRRNELEYYSTGKSIIHYFPSSSADQEAYISAMRPLAKKYKEYLHFVITHAREFPEAEKIMGVKRLKMKKGRLSVQKGQEVFPYFGGGDLLNPEVVEGFLGDIIRGAVRAWAGEEAQGGHDEL
ncbi:hypothetical protein QBC38DRAFT_503693 [Podospora fimiseda]|uniref:Protein disulfide-isomerase n=1 Tax=Podospora fimiseda TaxID=252190 RepID=A0AAN6YP14_9PEZI|nr:hypothetical protein QBC38DRAFT_503693 [Podospora fimiseda]